ncbi:MAG: hypothetical protein JWR16_131 [Nevskia sp.]|nr:hypothetical protein [Nevskia sp.]
MKNGVTAGQQHLPGWRAGLICLLLVPLAAPLDRLTSGLFWHADGGFFLRDRWPLQLVYHGTRWAMGTLELTLLLTLIAAHLLPRLRKARAQLWFAVLALALGPGLITHTLLKDHWGRPRPSQIADFGGSDSYVPPWQPSAQCDHNCSFPSGHAVAGFYLITGAWLWPQRRRRWLLAGIAAGGVIGLVRIMQGGHFLSDVLAALAVVWLSNALLYRWMSGRGWLRRPARSPTQNAVQ